MPKENKYNVLISECGFDDFGNYDSWNTEIKDVSEEKLAWLKENSGKPLFDGSMFTVWNIQKL